MFQKKIKTKQKFNKNILFTNFIILFNESKKNKFIRKRRKIK